MINSFTVVIPAFREERSIYEVVRQLTLVCNAYGPHEILVVDDGSPDNTAELARAAGARVISHSYNKGYGAALKTGIRAARFSTVVFMDADGQHNPEDLPRLLDAREHYDMVVGARKGTSGSPLWRKPGKRILAWVVNHLVGRKIPDFNSGFRVLDRRLALRIMPLMPNGFSFSTTSTIAFFRSGYSVGYEPIKVNKRIGVSSVTVKDGFRTLLLIIRLVTIFAPLRVFLPVSAITLLAGIIFIINGYALEGVASVKGILLVLASLHFFLVGILIDQISAIRRGEVISELEIEDIHDRK